MRRGAPARQMLGWALACALAGGFIALFFAWPVATLLGRGLVADGALDLTRAGEVLADDRTWQVVGETLKQALIGTAVSVALGIPGAYVTSRLRFRGRGLLRAWIIIPFVLPTVVVGGAFRSLLGDGGALGFLGWDQTLMAVVLALVFFNYPVVVRTVGALWERLDPRQVAAARTLGASPVRAFFTITLPQLAPAIASAAGIVFLFCSTAFGIVMVLGGRKHANLEAEIFRQTSQLLNLDVAAVLCIVQLVMISAVLFAVSRLRRRGDAAAGAHAAREGMRPIGRRDLPVVALTGAVILGLQGLPLVSLLVRSFQTTEGWGLRNYALLSTTGTRNVLTVTVWQALGASLRVAVIATLIALAVAVTIVAILSRRPRSRALRRAQAAFDAFVMLPLGVSAVTIGFGLLITMHNPLGLPIDLRTSGGLIAIAQALVAIPLVVRIVLPVVRSIDPRQREAAATLGATPGRILRTVDWPVAARSIGLGAGFAMAASLGEFGASAFLVRPDTVTLPVVIYQLLGRAGADNYGMAMAAAVVLGAATTAVMMIAERFRSAQAVDF
ncbi:ABC transporter permease [Rarobacter faecitabidus]|uniref:Thiamine transport system permease protein n=1 Tax=Rarobacter faecitabidus TaxID=13243 RepID=A0A542ZAN8_RARFA|nr:iron ABC transporter permease [Rarobacter faecitabidus]TQL57396.1 thiamine transport system permease protein [Rarobacter faecitabidus]